MTKYNLVTFQVQANSLSGELPSEISRLTNLKALRLAGNSFNKKLPKNMFDSWESLGTLFVLKFLLILNNCSEIYKYVSY